MICVVRPDEISESYRSESVLSHTPQYLQYLGYCLSKEHHNIFVYFVPMEVGLIEQVSSKDEPKGQELPIEHIYIDHHIFFTLAGFQLKIDNQTRTSYQI